MDNLDSKRNFSELLRSAKDIDISKSEEKIYKETSHIFLDNLPLDALRILKDVHDNWMKTQEQLIKWRNIFIIVIGIALALQIVVLIFCLIYFALQGKDFPKGFSIYIGTIFVQFMVLPLQIFKYLFPQEIKEYTTRILELVLNKMPTVENIYRPKNENHPELEKK